MTCSSLLCTPNCQDTWWLRYSGIRRRNWISPRRTSCQCQRDTAISLLQASSLLVGLRNSTTLSLHASSFFRDLRNSDLTTKNFSPVLEDRGHFFAADIKSSCWPDEPSHSAFSGVKLFSLEESGSHYKEPLANARRIRQFLYFRHRVFLSTWETQSLCVFRRQAFFTTWGTRILLRRTPHQCQKNTTSLLQASSLLVGLRNLLLRLSRRRTNLTAWLESPCKN